MSVAGGLTAACYHRQSVPKPFRSLHLAVSLAVLTVAPACVPKTEQVKLPLAPVVDPTVVTWDQKLGWIMRLEDQRILRDPNPLPPAILRPATAREPALVASPAPSDLIRLLSDPDVVALTVGFVTGADPGVRSRG